MGEKRWLPFKVLQLPNSYQFILDIVCNMAESEDDLFEVQYFCSRPWLFVLLYTLNINISFTSTVPSVMVKIKRFQEFLTQLLQQHNALSHVLPALKDVVRNGIDFKSIVPLLSYMHLCLLAD